MPSRRVALIAAGLVPVCFLLVPGAPAQIPEKFENLKILPKEIGQRELLEVMRGFSMGLDVRCQHCHVGEEGKPFSEFDFASDEKPAKTIARSMMVMVRDINDKHIKPLKTQREARIEVTCRTCHHGQALPRPLDDVLAEAHAKGGAEALLARYTELRDRFLDRGAFDFGEWALDDLAMRMTADGKGKDALALMELHAASHPGSSHPLAVMGEIHARLGDKEKAIDLLEKAVAMDPSNRGLQQKLKGLKGGT